MNNELIQIQCKSFQAKLNNYNWKCCKHKFQLNYLSTSPNYPKNGTTNKLFQMFYYKRQENTIQFSFPTNLKINWLLTIPKNLSSVFQLKWYEKREIRKRTHIIDFVIKLCLNNLKIKKKRFIVVKGWIIGHCSINRKLSGLRFWCVLGLI